MAEKKFTELSLEEMDAALLESQAAIDKMVADQHVMKSLRDVKAGEKEAADRFAAMGAHAQAAVMKHAQSIAAAGIASTAAVGTPGK